MSIKPTKRKSLLRHFAAATGGVAAIEFAFLAPMLMITAFGTLEVSRAVLAQKRFQRTVAMVADLVAREQTLGANATASVASLQGIVEAADASMWPYTATNLKLGITAIRASGPNGGTQTVAWSYSHNGQPVTSCGGTKALPQGGMVQENNYAILVEGEYKYTHFGPQVLNLNWSTPFKSQMINAPRNACVMYRDALPNSTAIQRCASC